MNVVTEILVAAKIGRLFQAVQGHQIDADAQSLLQFIVKPGKHQTADRGTAQVHEQVHVAARRSVSSGIGAKEVNGSQRVFLRNRLHASPDLFRGVGKHTITSLRSYYRQSGPNNQRLPSYFSTKGVAL